MPCRLKSRSPQNRFQISASHTFSSCCKVVHCIGKQSWHLIAESCAVADIIQKQSPVQWQNNKTDLGWDRFKKYDIKTKGNMFESSTDVNEPNGMQNRARVSYRLNLNSRPSVHKQNFIPQTWEIKKRQWLTLTNLPRAPKPHCRKRHLFPHSEMENHRCC